MKLIVRFAIMTGIMVASLFLSAGRWDWLNGWALAICTLGISGFTSCVLARHDPDLIAERAKGFKGGKSWDKVLSPLIAIVSPLAMWITAGIDVRYHGLAQMPAVAVAAGWMIAIPGAALTYWAMRHNRFFAAVVRIQTERGHSVQSGGPYAFVRHPGYVGASAYTLGVPLILNSPWTFVPSLLTVALTVVRTALEDATLQRELEGYSSYTTRVRYRILPGIW